MSDDYIPYVKWRIAVTRVTSWATIVEARTREEAEKMMRENPTFDEFCKITRLELFKPEKWGVAVYRSKHSPAGEASAWYKQDGKYLWYEAEAEAADRASELNKECKSQNVTYKAVEVK